MTRDTLGVAALARAIEFTDYDAAGAEFSALYYEDRARELLAALSPADRLAIAGITPTTVAQAIHDSGIAGCRSECAEPVGRPFSGADSDYATVLLRSLATPVTPEGGER